jgi:hypothetical protein
MHMNIYLLKRLDPVDYDEFDSKVVVAESEEDARLIAGEETGDEGQVWHNPKYVSCEVVDPAQGARVVCASFIAG